MTDEGREAGRISGGVAESDVGNQKVAGAPLTRHTVDNPKRRLLAFLKRHSELVGTYSSLATSLLAIGLSVYGIVQAHKGLQLSRETATIERRVALTETFPLLLFNVDAERQAIEVKNFGNGPAIIYYASISHNDKAFVAKRNVPIDVAQVQAIVNAALYDTFRNPPSKIDSKMSGLLQILDDGEKTSLLTLKTKLDSDQQIDFLNVQASLKILLCYVNLTGEMARGVYFSNDGSAKDCPQPPADTRVKFPDLT